MKVDISCIEEDDMIAYQLEEFFYANYGSRQKRKE